VLHSQSRLDVAPTIKQGERGGGAAVFERATTTWQDAPRAGILQAELEVGRSGDEAEREADTVAAAAVAPLRRPVLPGRLPLRAVAGPGAVVLRQRDPGKGAGAYEQKVSGKKGTVFQTTSNGIRVRFFLTHAELGKEPAIARGLAPMTAQIKKMNALLADQAYAVTQLLIWTAATTGFRLILGTPTVYVDSDYAARGDIGSVAHEMGHAVTHSYLQTSAAKAGTKEGERLRAMVQGIAEVYLALGTTKDEKLKDLGVTQPDLAEESVAVGHFMVDPMSWSKATEPEHPWQNYDEFFASAFEGFLLNRKGLEGSIARFSKKDAKVAAPAKQLMGLLEQFRAASSGKPPRAPKDTKSVEAEIARAGAVPAVEKTPEGGYRYPEVISKRPGGSVPEAPVRAPLLYLIDPDVLAGEEATLRRSPAGDEGPAVAPPIVHEVLATAGRPLDAGVAGRMAARLGHDFSRVRVHTDDRAAASARAVGARAYTVGLDVVFGAGRYRPGTAAGDRLMAHELAHVLQQRSRAPLVQRDPDHEDPGRFGAVHQALFVKAPSGGAQIPWVDATAAGPGSAGVVAKQFKDRFRQLIKVNPMKTGGVVPVKTTQSDLEADALQADKEIHARFPQIATTMTESALRGAVSLLSEAQTASEDFLLQWLDNRLSMMTDVDDYAIDTADPRYQRLLKDLLADSEIGKDLRVLASRQAAFHQEDAGSRRVFVHPGAGADLRRGILTHELIHFYTHPAFKEWVEATTGPRVYGEGFTEYLTRKVLMGAKRTQYEDHLQKVTDLVAKHASDDAIARAYFLGEVWRLELESGVAGTQFQRQTGLRPRARAGEEAAASRTGPGIVETVVPGRHYRFMNLGHDQATPKAEHEAALRDIWERSVRGEPLARMRFVGHASSPGDLAHNLELSRRRSAAFYALATALGVSSAQLLDADTPPHQGETAPTAPEANTLGRAFNRRVELFVVRP
jgi:outer membrane protein OmpA-like peptidoglycan-associated protein